MINRADEGRVGRIWSYWISAYMWTLAGGKDFGMELDYLLKIVVIIHAMNHHT